MSMASPEICPRKSEIKETLSTSAKAECDRRMNHNVIKTIFIIFVIGYRTLDVYEEFHQLTYLMIENHLLLDNPSQ